MKKIVTSCFLALLIAGNLSATESSSASIESIQKSKASLAGKTVTFQGKVVKVNNGIMQRNFIHVQEQGGDPSNNKLIVTSKQTAALDQLIKVTGKVTLDRDFGMGYSYPLLIEEATFTPVQ